MEQNQVDVLGSLDPKEFMNMVPKRCKVIASAPASPLPTVFAVNETAKRLHPGRQELLISQVNVLSEEAKSYKLVPNQAKGTNACAYFRAGQYLSIHLQIGCSLITRPYSIASSPQEALEGCYRLIVKRSSGGFASDYILNNWQVGTAVCASGPEGNFCYEPLRDAKVVLGIAGGSGITPFYGLACAIAQGREDCQLCLLYGSRKAKDILLKDEFAQLEKSCPRIKVIHVLSDEKVEGFETGFITADLVKKYAPVGENFSVFLCGPQKMYEFVDQELAKLNLASKWIRHELFGQWGAPHGEPGYDAQAAGKTFNLKVMIRGQENVLSCLSGESILIALERASIPAPSKCRSGECGYCHAKLLSGQVFTPAKLEGRRLADQKFGYIHPCSTFPLSDLVLEVNADPNMKVV